jgi:hypothetical protein
MIPVLNINFFAVLAGFCIEVGLGYLWYGRWFGKAWSRELGFSPHAGPMPSMMRRVRFWRWVSLAFTTFVVAAAMELIRPSTWGAGPDAPAWIYGLVIAVSAWAGFCLTPLLSRIAWEGASWKLVRIHAGYHLVGLLLVCQVFAWWS